MTFCWILPLENFPVTVPWTRDLKMVSVARINTVTQQRAGFKS